MSMNDHWDVIVSGLRAEMDTKHQAREGALRACRLLIQTCSKSIKHVHRRDFPAAQEILSEAKRLASEARRELEGHPELLYAGYLQDAEKEMVEAAACVAIAQGEPLPSRAELGVGLTSYLNGMGEAASECRRYVLDDLRHGRLADAERVLGQMETIYDDLTTFDYPDSLTGGLRRTCDALRAVVERTRSDLTMTTVQQELMRELRGKGP